MSADGARAGARSTALLLALVLLGFTVVGRLAIEAWLLKPVPDGLPEIGATADVAHPFLLVVVDGLNEQAAWAAEDAPMPFFQAFARRGASGIALAGDPTLTAPCVRALLTGRAPDLITAFRNFNARPVAGSLIGYLRARGGRTAHAGDATIFQLCRPHYAREDVYAVPDRGSIDQGETDDRAVPFLLERIEAGANVATLHLTRPDHAGHMHGATGEGYRAACRTVDRQLERVVGRFEALHPDALVLVAADHGVTATGSHGGGELSARRAPFALVGPGVARRGGVEVSQFALAPTIAALLGLPQPPLADAPPSREILDLAPERELAALDAYLRARLAVARAFQSERVDPIERRRAEVFVGRLAPGGDARLLSLAGELNRLLNPSSMGYATATLLLAALWLATVVHLASRGREPARAGRLALATAAALVLALEFLPAWVAALALLVACVLALAATGTPSLQGGLLVLSALAAVPVVTGASLSLQSAVDLAGGGGGAAGRIAGMLVALLVVFAAVFRGGRVLERIRRAARESPGLVPAFGGVLLGFTLTLRPFADPLLAAVHPALDLSWPFALVGLGAVACLVGAPAARALPAGRRMLLAALALLLFGVPRLADLLLEGRWLDQVARRDDVWLLAGAALVPLLVPAVGTRRLARADAPGLLLAVLALALAYAVRLDPGVGPLVARGAVLAGLGALVWTVRAGTPDGRLLVRLLAAVALARRLTALDGEVVPFEVLALGAALAARLPGARTRLGLAWVAVALLAIRIATFHAMGGTESFSTVDVAAGFVGLEAPAGPQTLAEGASGVTWQVVEAGIQLALRFSLVWVVLLAALARALASSGATRRVLQDVAVTFVARGAALALALWAWWRSAWWMEKAYPVFALGAADVVLLVVAACLVGAFTGERSATAPGAVPLPAGG